MDVDAIGDLLFGPLNTQESLDDMQYEDSTDEQMLDMFEYGGESEDDLFDTRDDCDLFDADNDCDLFDATLEETNKFLVTTDTPVLPDDDLLMQECDDRSLDAAIQANGEYKQQHRDR